MKLKKFEVEEIWSCRNFKLNKFEVEEIWSWKNLKLKRSGRNLKLKNFKLKNWAILGVREGFKNYFEVYSCSWTTLISYVFFNSNFCFWLNFGSVCTFWGPNGLFLGVRVAFKNYFRVYSCRWTTFVFYSSFNFDFGFWLNFGSFLAFRGPNGLFLGSGWGSKTVLGSPHID